MANRKEQSRVLVVARSVRVAPAEAGNFTPYTVQSLYKVA